MPDSILTRCSSILLAVAVFATVTAGAESPWPRPQRLTGDRDADLIAALIGHGRFDDASAICDAQLRGVDPTIDAAARWMIRKSEVDVARRLAAGEMDQQAVDELIRPLNEFLSSYPAHRRALFVRAQIIATERALARHDVVAVAVSPTDGSAIDRALKRLARVTANMAELSDAVDLERAKLDNERDSVRDFGRISDLTRLEQRLRVDTVSMALLQTELFPSGSRDRITAAVRAEQAADDAAIKLPADTEARLAVERLKVHAILESGQVQRAEAELARLYQQLDPPISPSIESLHIRIDLARNRTDAAARRLRTFYGSSPADAPRSIEMDLTQLEFLLSGQDQQPNRVGAWLDMIQRRGGPYARRRGEAIALAKLRSSGSSQAVDPSLVAAQGQDWLRRGEPGRAGELLSAAALAELDDARAIRLASEAAAAFTVANRSIDAAKILSRVAEAKPQAVGAASAQLQAAILYADSELPDARQLVENSLRLIITRWPNSDPAKSARQWLLKLLSSQNRDAEAAEVATMIPADSIDESDIVTAIGLWHGAIRASDGESRHEVTARFEKSLRPLLENEMVAGKYRNAAAFLLDRESLSALPPRGAGSVSKGDEFAEGLINFRRDGTTSKTLETPPQTRIDDATWRLMIDGRRDPNLRDRIAELLTAWPDESQPSLVQAERLIWKRKPAEAIQAVQRLIKSSNAPGATLRSAARLFGSSDDDAARTAAIGFWDEIAAGTPRGGDAWHEAKLEAIELLRRAGRLDEARRRAKYVLLTAAPQDEGLKQRYESAAGR